MLLFIKGDDFDDMEIAAFSEDVADQADNFKTLGQINEENEKKAKE
jgi:hypothetical protein